MPKHTTTNRGSAIPAHTTTPIVEGSPLDPQADYKQRRLEYLTSELKYYTYYLGDTFEARSGARMVAIAQLDWRPNWRRPIEEVTHEAQEMIRSLIADIERKMQPDELEAAAQHWWAKRQAIYAHWDSLARNAAAESEAS